MAEQANQDQQTQQRRPCITRMVAVTPDFIARMGLPVDEYIFVDPSVFSGPTSNPFSSGPGDTFITENVMAGSAGELTYGRRADAMPPVVGFSAQSSETNGDPVTAYTVPSGHSLLIGRLFGSTSDGTQVTGETFSLAICAPGGAPVHVSQLSPFAAYFVSESFRGMILPAGWSIQCWATNWANRMAIVWGWGVLQ